jgi:DNA-binding response OmpR family regulator
MTLISNRAPTSAPAPASHVVLVTRSHDLAHRVRDAIVDEHTSLQSLHSIDAVELIETAPDVVILDAASPEHVAPRVLSRLRHRWITVLLVALAVPDEAASASLLDAGADDAIEARSSWTMVAARLNAATRRTRVANGLLRRRIGDIVYDREHRRVWCAGSEVEFAPRELAVLDALWLRAGELVRHDSLQDFVWSGADDVERSNRLEVYISYVRRKLQASRRVTIETLRGAGYRLVERPAEELSAPTTTPVD